jgi:hypothetical protein
MFDLFKKKTPLQKLITEDGIEHATERFAEIISRKLSTREIARQFILEELDGASQGNEDSQAFARSSGIPASEYKRALENSNPEIDGPDGPQQQLLALSMQLMPNQALMAEFRRKVVDKVLKRFKLGKYASKDEQIANLFRVLKSLLMSDDSVVPALHPNIPTPEGAMKRHVVRREENIAAAKELISTLTSITGEGSREIVLKALDAAPQDDGWKERLTEWAKINNLPARKLIEDDFLQQQEYVGFPSDEQSITELSKNSGFLKGSFLEFHKSLEINLNFIPLSHLPKEFCRLSAVHVLYLHGCELKELPEEFGQLINLYDLDLGKNKLTSLPESLCSLSRLEGLHLHGNNLECLPSGIVHMSNLAKVNLSGNPELRLSNEQKKWLSSFSEDCIFVDDDLFARPASDSSTPLNAEQEIQPASKKHNYSIMPNGFTVEDEESGDGLAAVIRDGMFHGAVSMKGFGTGPLTPWPVNTSPFEDDHHYFGSGMSPQGPWSFSISPSAPFSQILREAREEYARNSGYRPVSLVEVVKRTASTKYGPFADMFEDLKSSKHKLVSDPLLSVATGYAMWLGVSGTFVAGGIRPDMVLDGIKMLSVFTKDSLLDEVLLSRGKAQALALAQSYVPELDDEAAEEVMSSAHEFINFYVDENRRLTVKEVVDSAKRRAKERTSKHVGWNAEIKI